MDEILRRVERVELQMGSVSLVEMKRDVQSIVDDLRAIEPQIDRLVNQVKNLRSMQHPQAMIYNEQVFELHKRRVHLLMNRVETPLMVELGHQEKETDMYERVKNDIFVSCDECAEWVRWKIKELSKTEFVDDLNDLTVTLNRLKQLHQHVIDFQQQIDQCSSRHVELLAKDSESYCSKLSSLGTEYEQLKRLSSGVLDDINSLASFVESVQRHLLFIQGHVWKEMRREWSNVEGMDVGRSKEVYKELMKDVEEREQTQNDLFHSGTVLINQGHPGGPAIGTHLTTMRNQWKWLLSLARCFEVHLQDVIDIKQCGEEFMRVWEKMESQLDLMESGHASTEQLQVIRESFDEFQELSKTVVEWSQRITPLWQRSAPMVKPVQVETLCDYADANIVLRRSDACTLLNNYEMEEWRIRGPNGKESVIPSVVFRIVPPDVKLLSFLDDLHSKFKQLRELWLEKHRNIEFNTVFGGLEAVRSWDIDKFMGLSPEDGEEEVTKLNQQANKLFGEATDHTDPLIVRLKEDISLTNMHYQRLLDTSKTGPGSPASNSLSIKISKLLEHLSHCERNVKEKIESPVPDTMDALTPILNDHKDFEDELRKLDNELFNTKQLYHQLTEPTQDQEKGVADLEAQWTRVWKTSKNFVDCMKSLNQFLTGMEELQTLVSNYHIAMSGFTNLSAKLDRLRGIHSQLMAMNMSMKQQQSICDDVSGEFRQFTDAMTSTRSTSNSNADLSRLHEEMMTLMANWSNVCTEVSRRLTEIETGTQILVKYRSDYEHIMIFICRFEMVHQSMSEYSPCSLTELGERLSLIRDMISQLHSQEMPMRTIVSTGISFLHNAKEFERTCKTFKRVQGSTSPIPESIQPDHSDHIFVQTEIDQLNDRFKTLDKLFAKELETVLQKIDLAKKEIELSHVRENLLLKQQQETNRNALEEQKRKIEQEERSSGGNLKKVTGMPSVEEPETFQRHVMEHESTIFIQVQENGKISNTGEFQSKEGKPPEQKPDEIVWRNLPKETTHSLSTNDQILVVQPETLAASLDHVGNTTPHSDQELSGKQPNGTVNHDIILIEKTIKADDEVNHLRNQLALEETKLHSVTAEVDYFRMLQDEKTDGTHSEQANPVIFTRKQRPFSAELDAKHRRLREEARKRMAQQEEASVLVKQNAAKTFNNEEVVKKKSRKTAAGEKLVLLQHQSVRMNEDSNAKDFKTVEELQHGSESTIPSESQSKNDLQSEKAPKQEEERLQREKDLKEKEKFAVLRLEQEAKKREEEIQLQHKRDLEEKERQAVLHLEREAKKREEEIQLQHKRDLEVKERQAVLHLEQQAKKREEEIQLRHKRDLEEKERQAVLHLEQEAKKREEEIQLQHKRDLEEKERQAVLHLKGLIEKHSLGGRKNVIQPFSAENSFSAMKSISPHGIPFFGRFSAG